MTLHRGKQGKAEESRGKQGEAKAREVSESSNKKRSRGKKEELSCAQQQQIKNSRLTVGVVLQQAVLQFVFLTACVVSVVLGQRAACTAEGDPFGYLWVWQGCLLRRAARTTALASTCVGLKAHQCPSATLVVFHRSCLLACLLLVLESTLNE